MLGRHALYHWHRANGTLVLEPSDKMSGAGHSEDVMECWKPAVVTVTASFQHSITFSEWPGPLIIRTGSQHYNSLNSQRRTFCQRPTVDLRTTLLGQAQFDEVNPTRTIG